jgi:hypothetical protein
MEYFLLEFSSMAHLTSRRGTLLLIAYPVDKSFIAIANNGIYPRNT